MYTAVFYGLGWLQMAELSGQEQLLARSLRKRLCCSRDEAGRIGNARLLSLVLQMFVRVVYLEDGV